MKSLRWAEINLDNLLFNYRQVKKLAGDKGIIAVVKANAYGHGACEVARFLEQNTDVCAFAVATAEEGVQLRQAGIKKKILTMSQPVQESYVFVENELTPVVYDFENLEKVQQKKIKYHIKIDTGMGRLGFMPSELDKLLNRLDENLEGIMSHFPSSDEDEEFTKEQFSAFLSFVKRALSKSGRKLWVHIDNSAALPYKFDNLLTHSRVGIALYGARPSAKFPLKLRQVMTVKAKLIQKKKIPPGWSVSYGRTYRANSEEEVGVVCFGYADGLLRNLSNIWSFKIKDKICRIRGRVCMDMTVVNLNGVPAEPGDEVIISDEELNFEKMAALSGTIPYEVMCGISPRVKRVFIWKGITKSQ